MNGGKVRRLIESLRECKGMLERVQLEEEGRGHMPWPEVQRADAILGEFKPVEKQKEIDIDLEM